MKDRLRLFDELVSNGDDIWNVQLMIERKRNKEAKKRRNDVAAKLTLVQTRSQKRSLQEMMESSGLRIKEGLFV